jgi:hypothetical protein
MKAVRLIVMLLSVGFSTSLASAQEIEPPPMDTVDAATLITDEAAVPTDPLPVARPQFLPASFSASGGDIPCAPHKFSGCCDCQCCDPSGFTFSWKPDRWAKVGVGLRTSYNTVSDNAPGIGGNFFAINNARLLVSGQVAEYIGFELNSDISNAQGLNDASISAPAQYNFLDGIVKFEFNDGVNFWMGQFLPPSDRSNLDGPFFINGWDFPFVQNYPAIFQGREIGAAYWGQWNGGQIKWSAGFFNGTGRTLQSPFTSPPDSPPNPNGNPLQFASRVTFNFLDPEPGYYNQSTYYGKKDILAIGLAMQTQNDAVGTAADARNFTGLSIDGLFEKKLANDGVITVEGALYHYDNQDLPTSSQQGDSGFVFAGYLMPHVWNAGQLSWRFRPFTRYLNYRHDFLAPSTGLFSDGIDIGTEAVINGHNARITAFWGERDVIGGGNIQLVRIGAQLIF